jgi:hypothetical protein
MDHRCGTRFSMSVAVELRAAGRLGTPARLVVASVTGAVVETRMRLPPLLPVLLRPLGSDDPSLEIEAYVVRATERGVALEWQDPASDAVLALLPPRVETPALAAVQQPAAVTGGWSPAA